MGPRGGARYQDDVPYSEHPALRGERTGTLVARYYDDYVHKGHALKGAVLDEAGTAALAAMREIVEARESWLEFRLAAGQLQYLNNRQARGPDRVSGTTGRSAI